MARDFVDSMLFLVDRGEIASEAAVDVLISTISEANSLLSRWRWAVSAPILNEP